MGTYYVSASTGSDGAAGTAAAPLATLQAAANLVQPGDTVEVMNGTYTGPAWGDVLDITTSGTSSAPITFEAAPGQNPVIDSSGAWNGIDVQASNIVIKGFTVEGDAAKYTLAQAQAQETNTGDPTFDGNGIMVQPGSGDAVPNHVLVENNTVFNEPGGGIGTNGADYVQILNNTVYNNANWSPYDNSGISVYDSENSDTNSGVHYIISGNASYDNADKIPDAFTGSITDGEGIILDTNTNYTGIMEVEGNTTYGNSGPGIEDFLTNNAVITGNTSYGNNTGNLQSSENAEIFINQSVGSAVTGNTTTAPSSGGSGSTTGSGGSGGTTGSSSSGGAPGSSGTQDTLVLRLSEDAWQGDALFTVKVDGTQIGGVMAASHLHSSATSDVFLLDGNWGSEQQDVQISFINDASGGTASTGRNLYIDSIAYDGKTYAQTSAAVKSNSTDSFSVGGSLPTTVAPSDTITVKLSEDSWNGNAKFALFEDGKQISTPQQVTALHSSATWQDFTFSANLAPGQHTLGVEFTNDAYGGSASTDRNLYVGGISVNGNAVASSTASLMSNGTHNFSFTA